MTSLDDPAFGLFPTTTIGVLGFITPRLDVRDATTNSLEYLSDCFEIVAFVQHDFSLQTILESWHAPPGIANRRFLQPDIVHIGTSYSQLECPNFAPAVMRVRFG